jgi:hypothetical protein
VKKAVRDRLAAIEQAGLTLVAVDLAGAKHIKAVVKTTDGRTTQVIISRSPPDAGHARQTFRAQLRRFAQPAAPQ